MLSNSTCLILERLVTVFYSVVLTFTSLLFFFRTRAIFRRNPWVVAFFAGLWLAVLGVCLAFVVDVFIPVPVDSASNICLKSDINSLIAATTIIPLINDTLVFLAISWHISCNPYHTYTLRSSIRYLIFGDHLPVFSRVLLQDGQAYYLLALP